MTQTQRLATKIVARGVIGSGAAEPLLPIADIAILLGVEVRHVRRLVQERRIPFIKWGHLLRFDPAEIRDWVDQNRHRTVNG